ncbi:pyruvate dehydrogenase E1 component subunit beta-3, chloroplastic-like [Dendrobium catenatum]|nr:pyruvate dehydrogenase E1 component subunit beta-3, chloroplastic-like [Dendrobium catenatum]
MAAVLQAAALLMGSQTDIKRFRLRSALRSAPVRHEGFFVVRTDGRLSATSGMMPRRAKLIPNAVAVKEDTPASSAASKPG